MRVLLTEGTALNGEVLRERVYETAVNRAVAADNAFAREFFLVLAEVHATVVNESIELDESAFVKEQIQALVGSQLAFAVLLLDGLVSAALADVLDFLLRLFDSFLNSSHILPPKGYYILVKITQALFCTIIKIFASIF